MLVILLASVISLVAVEAQVVTWLDGGCPTVTTKENFKIEAYMGKWFDIKKYPNSFQDGSCGIANYTLLADGSVKVNNTEIGKDGFPSTSIGEARPDPKSTIASRLQLRFSKWQPWGKYWVLDTDYNNYSVVYSCSSYLINRVEFLFVLGRSQSLSAEINAHIEELLRGFKIDGSKMVETDQSCQWQ